VTVIPLKSGPAGRITSKPYTPSNAELPLSSDLTDPGLTFRKVQIPHLPFSPPTSGVTRCLLLALGSRTGLKPAWPEARRIGTTTAELMATRSDNQPRGQRGGNTVKQGSGQRSLYLFIPKVRRSVGTVQILSRGLLSMTPLRTAAPAPSMTRWSPGTRM
jgi:hypothetical protein